MFATEAFSTLISARGGEYNVQRDGQLYELHAREMVIPAATSERIREVVERGGGSAANMNDGGGDTHFHYHSSPTIYGANRSDVEQALKNDRAGFYRFLKNEHSNGYLRKLALKQ